MRPGASLYRNGKITPEEKEVALENQRQKTEKMD